MQTIIIIINKKTVKFHLVIKNKNLLCLFALKTSIFRILNEKVKIVRLIVMIIICNYVRDQKNGRKIGVFL
jgi:ribosomal protein L13E